MVIRSPAASVLVTASPETKSPSSQSAPSTSPSGAGMSASARPGSMARSRAADGGVDGRERDVVRHAAPQDRQRRLVGGGRAQERAPARMWGVTPVSSDARSHRRAWTSRSCDATVEPTGTGGPAISWNPLGPMKVPPGRSGIVAA